MQNPWTDAHEQLHRAMWRVLAEPKRVRLLYLLANGETSVSDPNIRQSPNHPYNDCTMKQVIQLVIQL